MPPPRPPPQKSSCRPTPRRGESSEITVGWRQRTRNSITEQQADDGDKPRRHAIRPLGGVNPQWTRTDVTKIGPSDREAVAVGRGLHETGRTVRRAATDDSKF